MSQEQEDFVELFEVRGYTGVLKNLADNVEKSVNGVNSVFLKTEKRQGPYTEVEDDAVAIEITFDPLETDRTQICFDIEDFENVYRKATSA